MIIMKKIKKKIKKILKNIGNKNIFFRKCVRNCFYLYRKLKYFKYYVINKVDDKIIVFVSFRGKNYSDSPKAIYKEMQKDEYFKDYTFVWAVKKPNNYKEILQDRTVVIKYGSKHFYKYMSKAKYWITNSRFQEYLIKKKNQISIQCWHGTPFKRLACDIIVEGANALYTVKELKKEYVHDAKMYDYMVSPSAFCTEKFRSAFNLKKLKKENIIVETGYPRNDFLINHTIEYAENLKNKLGIPNNKKVILYAPTWRDNQHTENVGYIYDFNNIDLNRFKEKLEKDYVIIFRAHYLIANSIDFERYKGFIFDMSSHDDVNDCYVISDLIITDYSSVFFDYANLKRPILFYMYDLQEYKCKLRDFYFGLDELPGPIIETQEELENEILNIDKYESKYKEKYKVFNSKFNYLDDGKATKRVIEEIIKKN